jgi:hypothetical protein
MSCLLVLNGSLLTKIDPDFLLRAFFFFPSLITGSLAQSLAAGTWWPCLAWPCGATGRKKEIAS